MNTIKQTPPRKDKKLIGGDLIKIRSELAKSSTDLWMRSMYSIGDVCENWESHGGIT